MSHIHIPDGIIPNLWWIAGYILTAVVLFVLIKKMEKEDIGKKVPLAGMAAAIMLVGMSIPLGFIPLHFSLAVLVGILVGPTIGFIVVFTVNLILALFGHGGITIVGLNTLIIGSEVIIGYYLFKGLTKHWGATKAAVGATVVALLVSLTLMVGLVGATVGLPEALPHDHHDHDHDHHHGEDEDHHHDDDEDHHHDEDEDHHHDEDEDHHHDDHGHDHHSHDESFIEAVQDLDYFLLTGWGALIAILVIGIGLEAGITALLVRFLQKVRPDLLRH